MRTKKPIQPDGAFVDAAKPPTDADLKPALGRSLPALEKLLVALRIIQPKLASEWRFSPRCGWYRIGLLKKRRLFYLLPRRESFRLNLILGDKALAELAEGPHAATAKRLQAAAKRWPEGTAFTFDAEDFDPKVVLAFVQAKIAH